MKLINTILLFVVLGFSANAQISLNGVNLPAKLVHQQTELVLNGGGVRKKMFFKVYVVGLYLSEKNKNAHEIYPADKPMALRLQITSSMVSSNNMSEAIREGFNQSTGGKIAPLKDKIDAFIQTFAKEKITQGNIFDIYYVPGVGVQTFKNNKLQSTIDGLDFKKALFGIWLADMPVDDHLKKGLLGL